MKNKRASKYITIILIILFFVFVALNQYFRFDENVVSFVILSIGILVTSIYGIVCLFWTERVQIMSMNRSERFQKLTNLLGYHSWINKPSYLLLIRLIGIISSVVGVFLCYVFVRRFF
ncbi:MAG: hypothetical protein HQM16_14570 [Deltaproteobacteria bacterium]|nr:hypothetical protein [Deltaproteobacteria bacterium]